MRITTAFAALALLAAVQTAGPARAQDQPTADQLNKLSLEALTATPPRGSGGGGYAPTPHRRYAPAASQGRGSYGRSSYRHQSYGHSSLGRAPSQQRSRAVPMHTQRHDAAPAPRRQSRYTPHFYRR